MKTHVHRWFRAICAITLIATSHIASAQPFNAPDADATMPAPEAFAIFPWDRMKPTPEAFAGAKECGFNLAGFVETAHLDLVKDAGLKCFVHDPAIKIKDNEKASDDEIATVVKGITDRVAKHPAVFGYHLIDEPNTALVPTVAKWAKAFQAADPDHVAFTNFLPIFGTGGPGEREATYEKYLTSYLDPVKPRAFSFDQYGIMDNGTIRGTYFQCLEVVRRASQKSNVPFWHVALANAHFNYAEPSPATLRFQVFASLAYGARGIGWFTYTGRDRGNYRNAAIDHAGRRTPTWEMLREANLMAWRLAPTYTTLKSVNVFHHPTVPLGCRGIGESKFLADVQGSAPFCVGEFEDPQGRPAVIVVNCDLTKSTQINIVPKQRAMIMRVSSMTFSTRPWGAEDNWLPPGGGILLLLNPPEATTSPAK